MRPARILAAALALAAATLGAGCSRQPVAYGPAAYGETGHCYYVDDPAEAIALQVAGLCPSGWVPTIMPVYWHARYAMFYDSPTYYNRYVPVATRTVYVTHVHTFETAHSSDITRQRASATYKGSNGKSYTGSKVSPGSFGGGARSGGGGGGARSSSGTVRSSGVGSSSRSSSGSRSGGGGGRK